ncbi:MAG: ABC transporter permease [Leptolyngbyaceae cyanobacterium SM1_1_3]|nr:ABC transporter permease [Leptolyngbyaceae cyanobacterium SM1_1_3]NJN04027.1 ABC transporter permease [Leptolyngbyaceae cyanobacterium RM1_1_2]NJO09773.1 ABC transporter permease [Leptolyngbyaceae cyanobacterium SL_1_1]
MSRSASLRNYVLARLLLAPLMIWTITTLVFLLLRATPGDPIDALLGPRAPAAAKEVLRSQLGLDAPLWLQYIRYLGDLLRLDLGTSISSQGQTVWQIIGAHFPATVELTIGGLLIAAAVGVSVGAIAASRPNSPVDAGGRLFGILTYAVPMYWFGMILQLIFAVQLRWFPIGTRFPLSVVPPAGPTGLYVLDSLLHGNIIQCFTALHYLTLPCMTLGILISGIFERMVRVNLKQTLRADYVEAARARGIPERQIVVVHALKNALIPVITILGLTFASMLGGAVLTEVTFSWPGLANRLYEAISQRDYPVVQGLMVFFAAIVALMSILIDVLNAYIDPRIRY